MSDGRADSDSGRTRNTVTPEIKKRRDKDVLFALVLILGSIGLIVYSLDISFKAIELMDAKFYTAPGFTLMMIVAAILVLGIHLLIVAIRQGGGLMWLLPGNLKRIAVSSDFRQTIIVFFYLFLYMVVFWENVPFTRIPIPFWLATFFFLSAMMLTFKAAKPLHVLVISAITAGVIDFAFRVLAKIPLP